MIQMPKPSGVFGNSNPDFHRQIIKICTTKKQQTGHQVHAKVVRIVIIKVAESMSRARYLLERNGSLFKYVINE